VEHALRDNDAQQAQPCGAAQRLAMTRVQWHDKSTALPPCGTSAVQEKRIESNVHDKHVVTALNSPLSIDVRNPLPL
jgi:hypothetical protein